MSRTDREKLQISAAWRPNYHSRIALQFEQDRTARHGSEEHDHDCAHPRAAVHRKRVTRPPPGRWLSKHPGQADVQLLEHRDGRKAVGLSQEPAFDRPRIETLLRRVLASKVSGLRRQLPGRDDRNERRSTATRPPGASPTASSTSRVRTCASTLTIRWTGTRGATRRWRGRAPRTSPSCSRSATRHAIGAT